jgi:serine/threonine protein phosphatase PrpC
MARRENEDRVLARRFRHAGEKIALIGVSDGVSCCPAGGKVAAYLIDRHFARDPIFSDGAKCAAMQLSDYVTDLHTRFYNEWENNSDMLESGATLSIALLHGHTADCYWVGDSPILVARRNGKGYVTTQISVPDTSGRLLTDCFGAGAPFDLKRSRVSLRGDDVLAVATDGAMRDATLFGKLLDEHGATRKVLRAIRRQVRTAEYFDDASVALAQSLED